MRRHGRPSPETWTQPRLAASFEPHVCANTPGADATCHRTTRSHPTWGATYLRIRLNELDPNVAWPSPRTLQRWCAGLARPAAPPGRKPTRRGPRVTRPHESWQIDASDQLPLANGQRVSWFRVTDEASGAFLHTKVSPRPTSIRCRLPQFRRNSAGALNVGEFPSPCGWTVAVRGERGMISRPRWCCG